MSRTFFTSDHHFGHKQIIDFESRPYEDVNEMNEDMIVRWNSVVNKEDIVYHVGDFSFLNFQDTEKIFKQLKGCKRLILGNHDRARSKTWWKNVGFEEVYEHPICYKEFYWISHEPMYMNKHMPYVNLHGHIHSQKYDGFNHFNLSVEHWDYTPIAFDRIQQIVIDNTKQPS